MSPASRAFGLKTQVARLPGMLRKYRLGAGVFLISVIAHLILFIPWVADGGRGISRSGTFASGTATGQGDDERLVVELFQIQAPLKSAFIERSEPSSASLIAEALVSVDVSMPPETESAVESISEAFSTPLTSAATPPSPTVSESEMVASPLTTSGQAASGSGTSQVHSNLWKVIEPCWLKLGGAAQTVTLRVSFSAMGNISAPPQFVDRQKNDTGNALSSSSEQRALTALQQCGPYVQAYGQADVEIVFPEG